MSSSDPKKTKGKNQQFKEKINSRFSSIIKSFRSTSETGSHKRNRWKPELVAYRLIGEKINKLLPVFEGLYAGLYKSDMYTSFKPYVSLMFLTSFIVGFSTLLILPIVLFFLCQFSFFLSMLLGLGGSFITSVSTFVFFYVYPFYRADKIKRSLNDTMTFSTSYLAILAGAGVPPNGMFVSISRIPQDIAIVRESKRIVRDVELFGTDMITALEKSSKRTSSQSFKELLEGYCSTIRSGGDLVAFLTNMSQRTMKLKQIALKQFSDTLGVLSEFYVTLLIAGPLIFLVMLSVFTMLGGFGFGILNPTLILALLSYVYIPVGSIIFILILDILTPGDN